MNTVTIYRKRGGGENTRILEYKGQYIGFAHAIEDDGGQHSYARWAREFDDYIPHDYKSEQLGALVVQYTEGPKLNLYLLSQTQNGGWDTHDSCLVVAETREDARQINPSSGGWGRTYSSWARDHKDVEVEYIGAASVHLSAGDIVCSSFNAG